MQICYTPEELKGFAQKAAARASKSQLAAQEDVQLMGIHNGITSSHGSKCWCMLEGGWGVTSGCGYSRSMGIELPK